MKIHCETPYPGIRKLTFGEPESCVPSAQPYRKAPLADAIAEATERGAFSIAGGGDTVAAVSKFGVADRVSYISTGGGAFLEFLEGKKLPAVAILEERA